jgi:hypothetical protein
MEEVSLFIVAPHWVGTRLMPVDKENSQNPVIVKAVLRGESELDRVRAISEARRVHDLKQWSRRPWARLDH